MVHDIEEEAVGSGATNRENVEGEEGSARVKPKFKDVVEDEGSTAELPEREVLDITGEPTRFREDGRRL